jgi:hypothetical protein
LYFEIQRMQTKLTQPNSAKETVPTATTSMNKKPPVAGGGGGAPPLTSAPSFAAAAVAVSFTRRGSNTSNNNFQRPGAYSASQTNSVSNSQIQPAGGIAVGGGVGGVRSLNNMSSMNVRGGGVGGLPSFAAGRGRRNAKFGDIGANTVFLGLSDRCGIDPIMQQWYRRIRNTPNGLKLFESLRVILAQQRKRHLMRLTAQQTRRKICPVRQKIFNFSDCVLSDLFVD